MKSYIQDLADGKYLAIAGAYWVEDTSEFKFTHALLSHGEIIRL